MRLLQRMLIIALCLAAIPAAAITSKYPSQTTRAGIEAGDVWVFEAAPRN